ncbi:MAG: GNAT family N-acetyltransferase [Vagococcus sp.]
MSISFELLDKNCEDWTTIADQISQVSWRAGEFLADKMYLNDFNDWEKVIVGKNSKGKLTSFCVVSKKDGLIDEFISPFIAYVFVEEAYRGKRLSENLLKVAEGYLRSQNFKTVYIVSGEVGLYEKYGYKKIRNCSTIHGDTENLFEKSLTNAD